MVVRRWNLWHHALLLSQIFHTAWTTPVLSYESYLQEYQKDLHRLQNLSRQERYAENLHFFHELEVQLESLNLSFSIRSNHFLDWFEDELSALFHPIPTPLQPDGREEVDAQEYLTRRLNANSEFSEELNWASSINPFGSSVLSSIQNQGECGACWAFAAAEATTASLRLNGYPLVRRLPPCSSIVDLSSDLTECPRTC
jgi:C1A family cysteine protease